MAGDVELDQAAIFDLLNSADGPVGELMTELSDQLVAVALLRVPVRRPGEAWSSRSDAAPVGYTEESLRTTVNYGKTGLLYGGAAAAEFPSVYLEDPREDRRREPFLTTGLDSLWI